MAYLNFDVIFEFLGQFTIRCIIIFQKDVDNFEIRAQNMLILELFGVGAVPPLTTQPQMTFDLDIWPLTSSTNEGPHVASMTC